VSSNFSRENVDSLNSYFYGDMDADFFGDLEEFNLMFEFARII